MKIDSLTPDIAILKELGSRLQTIRKQQGFTQGELALKAGLGVATLRRFEDGKDGQLGSWIKILKALDMLASLDQFLPESFQSPMFEVLSKRRSKRSKKSSTSIWADQINEPSTEYSS